MARTTQEIYDLMIADKEARSELAGLTSTSKTAIWRLLFWIAAQSIRLFEVIMDSFKVEVEAIAAAAKPLSVQWYLQKIFEFRLDQEIQLIDLSPRYDDTGLTPEAIAEMQIIKRAALVESNTGVIIVKVVKEAGGALTPLTIPEKTSFQAYMNAIQGAGDRISISSLNADELHLTGTIFYDATTWTLTDDLEESIETAINNYLAGIEFNGEFFLSKLTDAVQAVAGVRDQLISASTCEHEGLPIPIVRKYNTVAGYIELESLALTYTPFKRYQ